MYRVNITYGTVTIDESAHDVKVNNIKLELAPKEYELLLYLIKNSGITVSREQILNKIWGYNYFGDERTVDTHIKKLREKLGKECEIIKTVRGYGYKVEK